MKERIRYDGELEKQLKEKADQFKMYPSDKVWNEVYSSLHTRRRRFVAGMSALIGGILILAGSQLIFPARVVPGKTTLATNNQFAKPSASAVLPSFTTGDLTNIPNGNSVYQKTSSEDRAVSSPYIISATLVESSSGPLHFSENLPEKNVGSSHIRSDEPANLNI